MPRQLLAGNLSESERYGEGLGVLPAFSDPFG